MPMRALALFGFLVLAAIAAPAQAQIFKWVDEQGRVNYSNKPPPNVAAKPLDATAANISVYEAEKPVQPQPETTPAEVAALRDKVDRLQREVDARQAQSPPGAAPADAAARERCIAERRVDCDNPAAIQDGPATVLAPPRHIIHPVAPRAVTPAKVKTQAPLTAPAKLRPPPWPAIAPSSRANP